MANIPYPIKETRLRDSWVLFVVALQTPVHSPSLWQVKKKLQVKTAVALRRAAQASAFYVQSGRLSKSCCFA